ncbi:MAG: ATP synthase F1 subunit gamma, partial [Deltaproteobacteria bacterium]|nr:ATP synthase F1 subunit gamma [Deltaproteobacteria bacterium]
ITKAMKMVSAAKLRRAQQRLVAARPYTAKLDLLVKNVAQRYQQAVADGKPIVQIPLLKKSEVIQKAEFFILTSDRGLCGGFNGNLLRRTEDFIKKGRGTYQDITLSVVGKKGRDFFRARQVPTGKILTGLYDGFDFDQAMKLATEIAEGYQNGLFDSFFLVYNGFKSAISQEVRFEPLLPITLTDEKQDLREVGVEAIYEPSLSEVLEKLLPQWLATRIYAAFLESIASEQGARMAAMENATNNCRDMIYRLTLQLNRIRQAAITKELMDIVNGAESLK